VGGIRQLVVCPEAMVACAPPPGGVPADLGTVHALHQDESGRIWAGTDRGLLRNAAGGWTTLETGTPPPSAVRAFLERADGTLFMATNGAGILAWRKGRFSRIGEAALPTGFVRSLFLDGHGHLWAGTEGFGLARITLAETQGAIAVAAVDVIRQRDGLPDNVIHRILEDDDGRVWLSTPTAVVGTGQDS
jgi:ligand-binding sensor domain-containing protein